LNVNPSSSQAVGEAVAELRQLLSLIFHSLKQRSTGAAELEPLKHAFFEAGLRDRHARLLLTLASTGPLTIGELADRMGLASATTSLLAGELNRAGFLDRQEDEQDRRRTIVSLPKRLQTRLEQLTRTADEPLRRTLQQLDASSRQQLLDALRLLATESARTEIE
jgi:DNA-binding MarR family transcriptional regulator